MNSPTGPDLRPTFKVALGQVGDLLQGVRPDQLQNPTPCPEFAVQDLLEHIQGVLWRTVISLSGDHTAVPEGTPSDDWSLEWDRGCAALAPVLADDACVTREVIVPWGVMTGADALGMFLGEFVVHAWDLAIATDQTDDLHVGLAAAALPTYQVALPADQRDGRPFGRAVDVGPAAGAYERIVAWSGRNPSWDRRAR